ncbi:glycosyl transferase group 1 [Anaeromyxobacter dehalogenans 2CP-1]|uniref:Glycosyl transferase group 1 n=1 Tax=Anaeromyxobacter dehalogenans (strain ATCC BAA-258 / DSM 21875 / 2CP-1) TaxID=455488 RepID=B8JAQ3_ANAD2|nr:glycosyltransferase family 4 protein [Anaeromyxobacter dehalogenans]ACL67552.1 glycosyl transferase group 1 [Anaeromyxobacter dehalogenans 2CP-1]
MRVLYLHYGPQSGVTAAVTRSLAEAGAEVVDANPAEGFLYQLRPGCRIPNVRPAVVRAVAEALRTHGRSWKPYYLHTTFAFDHLSARAGEAIRRAGADAVIQAGVLFSPGLVPDVPYHLYLDHTRAIAERYPPLEGLPPPVPYAPEWRAREEAVYRGAAGIFTMSEAVRTSLLSDYGVSPARVHVVGAGPNVEPGPRDLGLAREPLVLFVGRNFVPKGGPELLEAFREVRRVHPRARLALVTSRAPAALPEGVTDHGLLGKEALARLYATAAVFALPTLREAFGLSFLEAMAFELPVVASRIEAIPEIVADGDTGLLVPPRDPAALAAALTALLGDPARARAMGVAGRARAAARFGWARAAARMLEVLRPAPALATGRGA